MRKLIAALVMAAAVGLIGAAGASAEATSYTVGMGCINLQVGQHVPNHTGYPLLQGLLDDSVGTVSGGSYVQVQRPVQATYYTGTRNLYWAPYVRLTHNGTGIWAAAQLNAYGVYPSHALWRAAQGVLYNLYWGGQAPWVNMQMYIPPGYTAQVWGVTYWGINGRWAYHQYHYYGTCRA